MSEFVDLYDRNRKLLNRVVDRNTYLFQPGEFMMYVLAILKNEEEEFLVPQRALDSKADYRIHKSKWTALASAKIFQFGFLHSTAGARPQKVHRGSALQAAPHARQCAETVLPDRKCGIRAPGQHRSQF